jgi:hypothetical protein
MTVRTVRIVLLHLFFIATAPATAAQIRVVDTSECTIELDGEISPEDIAKFKTAVGEIGEINTINSSDDRFSATLCLNSPGGSFNSAIEIINLFPLNLRTMIRSGHECLSACALVFLAGRMYKGLPAKREQEDFGDVPDRWLSIKGKLGFHAPYSPADGPGEKAYFAGVRAVAKLVAKTAEQEGARFFPPDLLAQALSVGPSEFFEVEWVHQAIHWNIRLADLKIEEEALTNCNIARACRNYIWAKVIGIQPVPPEGGTETDPTWSGLDSSTDLSPAKASRTWHSQGIKLSKKLYQSPKFVVDLRRRGTYVCAVQLHRSGSNGMLLDIVHNEEGNVLDLRKDQLITAQSWNGRLAGQSTSYLVNPNSRIRDIANAKGPSELLKCDKEG